MLFYIIIKLLLIFDSFQRSLIHAVCVWRHLHKQLASENTFGMFTKASDRTNAPSAGEDSSNSPTSRVTSAAIITTGATNSFSARSVSEASGNPAVWFCTDGHTPKRSTSALSAIRFSVRRDTWRSTCALTPKRTNPNLSVLNVGRVLARLKI